MDQRLSNFRAAYHLAERVRISIQSHAGDIALLRSQSEFAQRFLSAAERNIQIFSNAEYETLRKSIATMVEALGLAFNQVRDPVDDPALRVLEQRHSGGRGRPYWDFDPRFLEFALQLRGPAQLANFFGCSARTVRRRALEYGLSEPGEPLYQDLPQDDGTVRRFWPGTTRHTHMSRISDDELDREMAQLLQRFPSFGRRLIKGYFQAKGLHISRRRITESYLRVHGPPSIFSRRPIERRSYYVPGPNSLWHHDGQHGLIRYKLVTHLFIDGKSRFITGARTHNNNRAATVLNLFQDAMRHGVPRRVRGDHGTENIEVAKWMEAKNGVGSYIWGRSVHNTRVERVWFDFTQGVGAKWKTFFEDLELYHGLDPHLPGHIWLIHWLFYDSINDDLSLWVDSWNSHKVTLKGEADRSPRDMYLFGMIENGPRGIQHLLGSPTDINEDDIDGPMGGYGVDWEIAENPALLRHFLEHNGDDWDERENPFDINRLPVRMSEVICEVDDPHLPDRFVRELQAGLQGYLGVSFTPQDMNTRCSLWRNALQFCTSLFSEIRRVHRNES